MYFTKRIRLVAAIMIVALLDAGAQTRQGGGEDTAAAVGGQCQDIGGCDCAQGRHYGQEPKQRSVLGDQEGRDGQHVPSEQCHQAGL